MTEHPECAALWAAVGASPDDALPRLVLADWLEEREESRPCVRCRVGRVMSVDGDWCDCEYCGGTLRVSNGFAATAAGLRATAGHAPDRDVAGVWSWYWDELEIGRQAAGLPGDLVTALERLVGNLGASVLDYPTAEAAVRDLVRAWVAVNGRAG